MHQIRSYWHNHPLRSIVFLALVVRLLAAIFAKGYMMVDDHFLVIEAAWSWTQGLDYAKWLPWFQKNDPPTPGGHNFFYTGLHFLYFQLVQFLGLENPQYQMFILRIFHALVSITVPYFSFKIAYKLFNLKTAKTVGLMIALMAVLPNFSVRNLIEAICLPPLLWGLWLLVKSGPRPTLKQTLYAGALFGIAVGIRYQSVLLVAPFGLAYLILKQWKTAVWLGVSTFFVFFLTQATDLYLWKKPFAELLSYINYNSTEGSSVKNSYPILPWYNYFLLILGGLPFVSFFLLFGFGRVAKKHFLIFLPTLIFFAFHSYFPNKQERFLLPMLPFFIILGVGGWNQFVAQSSIWQARKKLRNFVWASFWVLNSLGLVVFTFSYTKRSRVEAMYTLYNQPDYSGFLLYQGEGRNIHMPMYYAGKMTNWNVIYKEEDIRFFKKRILDKSNNTNANYILIKHAPDFESRVLSTKKYFTEVEFIGTATPGLFDELLHFLNPNNGLEIFSIYRITP